MCTVTFLPLKNNNFILTSNRDETPLRETFPPQKYIEDNIELVFPKDKKAGGTWIGTSSKNRLVCVLNGAFEEHIRKEKYTKSRGVISKEILKSDRFIDYINHLDLTNIEPFTMVIVDWNNPTLDLYEFIWDEHKKHFSKLENVSKIWSSSALYKDDMQEVRKTWFKNWVSENKFETSTILNFHHSEIGDKEQSILMKRPKVETVSITSVKKDGLEIEMLYEDLIYNEIYETII